jgi:hypothetical protein
MVWVKEARYLDGFRIDVLFNDGTRGIVDLRRTIFNDRRRIFAQLKDVKAFRKFKVDMDTLVWENRVDLAPEYLLELARASAKSRKARG